MDTCKGRPEASPEAIAAHRGSVATTDRVTDADATTSVVDGHDQLEGAGTEALAILTESVEL